jgi:replicative DNA helicase
LDLEYGLEESILKIILSNPSIGQEVINIINPDFFKNPINRYIFLLYKEELVKGYKDEALFIASIEDSVVKNVARGIILENKADKAYWERYCNKLKEAFNKDRILRLAEIIIERCNTKEKATNIVADVSKNIYKIMTDSIEYEVKDISDIYQTMEHEIGTKDGLKTMAGIGLPALTKYAGDFDLGSIIGVAGRPSMGKTALAIEMVKNLSIDTPNPERSLFFSLETEKKRFLHRLISNGQFNQRRNR